MYKRAQAGISPDHKFGWMLPTQITRVTHNSHAHTYHAQFTRAHGYADAEVIGMTGQTGWYACFSHIKASRSGSLWALRSLWALYPGKNADKFTMVYRCVLLYAADWKRLSQLAWIMHPASPYEIRTRWAQLTPATTVSKMKRLTLQ